MRHETAPSPATGPAPKTKGHTIGLWAPLYDIATWLLSFGKEGGIRRTTIELAHLSPEEKVLDVGCGTGTLAIAAGATVGPGGEVCGIDASPQMIGVARRKAARKGAAVRFEVGLVESLPFPSGYFDVVLSSFMMHHLPGDLKREGLRRIHSVLKPGGRLLIVDMAGGHSPLDHLRSLLGHAAGASEAEDLAALLRESGFGQVEVLETEYKGLAFGRGRR